MKKIFGGINLTWKHIIIMALVLAIITASIAVIPWCLYTSFISITRTFEVWILIGIFIIMNSKSNKDAALKCFVFFLISQPLVYLFQVPFSHLGWQLFVYYKPWFIWTIFCAPMGYIGYYMKKNKWYSYLILLPMILLDAYSYSMYLGYFTFSYPKYLLVCLFCIVTMIIYPLYIFDNKKIQKCGLIISCVLICGLTIYGLMNPYVYKTTLLMNGGTHHFDDTYTAYFTDKKYGDLYIVYEPNIEDYMLQADLKKEGKAIFILESPDKEKVEYSVDIKSDTYDVVRK